MKKLLIATMLIGLVVAVLMAAPNAPIPGIIQSGSANVTVTDDGINPTSIAVATIGQGTNGVTVIGITNAHSTLYMPFMYASNYADFVDGSHSIRGLATNGVLEWWADGSNPGQMCVSPRTFKFQTNINWSWTGSTPTNWLAYSNDVGVLNEGSVTLSLELISTSYYDPFGAGNTPRALGDMQYVDAIAVSNGTVAVRNGATQLQNGGVNVPNCYILAPGVLQVPYDAFLYIQLYANGSFGIWITNGIGLESGYASGFFTEQVNIFTQEHTTGPNWPGH